MHKTLVAMMILAAGSGSALAGPAADSARAHFKAIAAGDVDAVTARYAPGTVFQWVGGPLDGVYADSAAIKGVWQKFIAAQGKLEVDVENLEEAANPKGATITANVVFKGKGPIPVRYVLVYREDKLVSEVWQINPPKQ